MQGWIDANMYGKEKITEALYESLKTIMEGFDQGVFVRNTHVDFQSEWPSRFISPYIKALHGATVAMHMVEGTFKPAQGEEEG